jgi:hypothetical protein
MGRIVFGSLLSIASQRRQIPHPMSTKKPEE